MPPKEAFKWQPTVTGQVMMTDSDSISPPTVIHSQTKTQHAIFQKAEFEETFTQIDSGHSFGLDRGLLDNQSDGLGEIWVSGRGTESQENGTLSLGEESPELTWLSPTTVYALMVTTGCVGIIVFLINVGLLVASKFVSGGRTPMMIFLRSLCVADALVGIFGVIKMTQFIPAMTWEWVNCFLPESVLFTATIASNLTHVMLSTMCFSMLKDMVRFDRKQDKHRTIFSMTFLWNGSFVIGFVPHMGWNSEDEMGWNSVNRKCLFLRYVTLDYLGLVTAIISLSIVWLLVVHIGVQVLIFRNKIPEPSLLELTSPVIFATRVDIVLQLTCYLPGALYIFLNCDSCAYVADQDVANDNLSALLPLMIVRATFSTALHFKRTDQMRDIIYYCFKIIKHHVLVKMGSRVTIRPARPSVRRASMRPFDKDRPHKVLPVPHKQSSQNPRVVPNRNKVVVGGTHPTGYGFSTSQPTIVEETGGVEQTSPGEDLSPAMSSAQSWSTSDITLASTVGSTSGGSSNGISPFPKQKNLPKPGANQNGVTTTLKSPKSETNSWVLGPYWVGEIPKRAPNTPKHNKTAAQGNVNPTQRLHNGNQASPNKRLLWAKSPLVTQFDDIQRPDTPKTGKKSTIQNENMDILSARRLDTEYEKWRMSKGNVLQSEVIVHVPADTHKS